MKVNVDDEQRLPAIKSNKRLIHKCSFYSSKTYEMVELMFQ